MAQRFKFWMHHKPMVVEFEIDGDPPVSAEDAAEAFGKQYPGWAIDGYEEITKPVLPN